MPITTILMPLCAQVMLTFLVWVWMYYTRLTTLYRSGMPVQDLADEAKAQAVFSPAVNPSDNFENLFELPTLFYTGIIVIFSIQATDTTYMLLAWSFVAFRFLHSLIHCFFNVIKLRFSAYLFASIALWAMWARISIQVLQKIVE